MDYLNALKGWCGGAGFWSIGDTHGWHGWPPFHFGGIFQLIIIGIFIYLIARIFRRPAATGPSSPQEVLRRRYALGEIDQKTFERMKNELQ